MNLNRYWFIFKCPPDCHPLNMGCGVTAYNYDDAITIIDKEIFSVCQSLEVDYCKKDIDISSLDKNHIIPNMEPVVWRGIWFPKGYKL